MSSLSQKEIGKRILELRKAKGLLQEEVARHLGIPRTSMVQLEQGNRSMDAIELHKLSLLLEFSVDEFLSKDYNKQAHNPIKEEKKGKPKNEERVAIPELNISKFKNVLLYILERCAGKPNVGETVLYKLLYFSDFNYFELYEDHLSGARYRKLPYGPVPKKFEAIVNTMIENEELKRIKTEYYDKTQTRYIPLIKPDLTILKASEKEVIDRVIEQMSDWSASAISNYSHNDMPWKASKEGEEISYELVFYRDAPYSVRNYGNETEEP